MLQSIPLKLSAGALLVSLGLSLKATATVDSMISYTVLRSAVQTEGYCEQRLPMMAEFGSPAAPFLQGLFAIAPVAHHSIGRPLSFDNINVLYDQGITYKLRGEDYDESRRVWTYRVRLDLSELGQAATSSEERGDVITKAKLAIIGVNSNIKQAVGTYKLYLEVAGLPSQSGLSGSRVYERTNYPYTHSSPLLAQYRQELINVAGECD